jgi:hypothetical protein
MSPWNFKLQPDWLSDNVRRFVSISGTFAPLEIEGLEESARRDLKITRPPASYLLALMCLASRPALPGYAGDVDDIRFLIRKMNLQTLQQVEDHIARFYPGDSLTARSREMVERLLAEHTGEA